MVGAVLVALPSETPGGGVPLSWRPVPPAEVAVLQRVDSLEDGTRCTLRYALIAFPFAFGTYHAITALVVRDGGPGARALDFGISPALDGGEARAQRIFRKIATAEAPVFPVHLADVVRDLLLQPAAARTRRRAVAG